jgi:hypothetical protein
VILLRGRCETTAENNNISVFLINVQAHNLRVIGELTKKIEWDKYLDFWKGVADFQGVLHPSREAYLEAVAAIATESTTADEPDRLESSDDAINLGKSSLYNKGVLRYRVTCHRSGKHTFGSQDAARSFGGQLQDMFNWVVNLDEFHLEVILQLRDRKLKFIILVDVQKAVL